MRLQLSDLFCSDYKFIDAGIMPVNSAVWQMSFFLYLFFGDAKTDVKLFYYIANSSENRLFGCFID